MSIPSKKIECVFADNLRNTGCNIFAPFQKTTSPEKIAKCALISNENFEKTNNNVIISPDPLEGFEVIVKYPIKNPYVEIISNKSVFNFSNETVAFSNETLRFQGYFVSNLIKATRPLTSNLYNYLYKIALKNVNTIEIPSSEEIFGSIIEYSFLPPFSLATGNNGLLAASKYKCKLLAESSYNSLRQKGLITIPIKNQNLTFVVCSNNGYAIIPGFINASNGNFVFDLTKPFLVDFLQLLDFTVPYPGITFTSDLACSPQKNLPSILNSSVTQSGVVYIFYDSLKSGSEF